MADEKKTAFFKGEGGSVFEMDLPLPEPLQYQVTRGTLRQCNPDGTGLLVDPAEVDGVDLTAGSPSVRAAKNEWVGYAVAQGMTVDEADAMTKNELIEKFGQ